MENEVKKNVIKFLYSNYDVMAYSSIDMERVSRGVIKPRLKLKKEAGAAKREKRNFALDK